MNFNSEIEYVFDFEFELDSEFDSEFGSEINLSCIDANLINFPSNVYFPVTNTEYIRPGINLSPKLIFAVVLGIERVFRNPDFRGFRRVIIGLPFLFSVGILCL